MKFTPKLENGTFIRRYKRFFADIEWQGQMITAHVANTGSLKGCIEPGSPCRFSVSDDPARKLKYSLEMVRTPTGTWVGVNTSLPNKIVAEALKEQLLPHWSGFQSIKAEAKLNSQTRFDFEAIATSGTKYYLEVKNVTLAADGVARFPDSVTERGQKHLRELTRLVGEGHEAELVFTVQRDDAQAFGPADEIDETYGRLLREAHQGGVRITPLRVELSEGGALLTPIALKLVL